MGVVLQGCRSAGENLARAALLYWPLFRSGSGTMILVMRGHFFLAKTTDVRYGVGGFRVMNELLHQVERLVRLQC